MAECCNNTVTPRMIKAGNVSVGDRIQLEEAFPVAAAVSGTAPQAENRSNSVNEAHSEEPAAVSEAAAAAPLRTAAPQTAAPNSGQITWSYPSYYNLNATKSDEGKIDPLPYSQMTQYMNNISLKGSMESPSIVTPQAPMTPNGYDEEIDYESVQAFNGFLRTQIGRYMRIEQLIGSNTIEDRFGFLVGVGTNFIILQEITTGNIMVLDLFSIRLTYVYYSPPVLPNL